MLTFFAKMNRIPKPQELNNARFSRNTGNPEFRKSHSFKDEKNVSSNHNSTFAYPSDMPARNTNTSCSHLFLAIVVQPWIFNIEISKILTKKKECLCERHTFVHLSYLPSIST
ncbi:hypothetical protein TNIN_427601 [Trichonephila inaurata madagascariensis]|uniref:Uncharacterized protein n=1 Tax=Trichonephila inaurata madagascariensis TaxID=2747483 RepID=A0A8X6WLZ0_9ARAC|nr:hypothetical protein TNIN_427601 [Trichonephila inaurata madagascariensis]